MAPLKTTTAPSRKLSRSSETARKDLPFTDYFLKIITKGPRAQPIEQIIAWIADPTVTITLGTWKETELDDPTAYAKLKANEDKKEAVILEVPLLAKSIIALQYPNEPSQASPYLIASHAHAGWSAFIDNIASNTAIPGAEFSKSKLRDSYKYEITYFLFLSALEDLEQNSAGFFQKELGGPVMSTSQVGTNNSMDSEEAPELAGRKRAQEDDSSDEQATNAKPARKKSTRAPRRSGRAGCGTAAKLKAQSSYSAKNIIREWATGKWGFTFDGESTDNGLARNNSDAVTAASTQASSDKSQKEKAEKRVSFAIASDLINGSENEGTIATAADSYEPTLDGYLNAKKKHAASSSNTSFPTSDDAVEKASSTTTACSSNNDYGPAAAKETPPANSDLAYTSTDATTTTPTQASLITQLQGDVALLQQAQVKQQKKIKKINNRVGLARKAVLQAADETVDAKEENKDLKSEVRALKACLTKKGIAHPVMKAKKAKKVNKSKNG